MHLKYLIVSVFLIVCLLWARWRERRESSEKPVEGPKPKKRRQLRPRTPKDCALCRAEAEQEVEETEERKVTPWSEVKSPRGRKKQKDTEGYACPNKGCAYYGITDARVHALVGYGSWNRRSSVVGKRVHQPSAAGGVDLTRAAVETRRENTRQGPTKRACVLIVGTECPSIGPFWAAPTGCWNYQRFPNGAPTEIHPGVRSDLTNRGFVIY
jgi:hypothetical protein